MTIAVLIPVFNSSRLLRDTLLALRSGSRVPDEIFVVDDGSTDDSAAMAETLGAIVMVMPHNLGPAACRNHAALLATSEILVFLDADTCVHGDTLARMEEHFANAGLTAVFGSYDDAPRDPGWCSQYRNLAHCYVHRSSKRAALTFWSGCGSVRREAFIAAEGFDECYRKPSIEDIELGYRMTDRGALILLDPAICVMHTKRWTLWSSIVTDVVDRGIPWMLLLLERGSMPNDLNLRRRHRIGSALTAVSFICLVASPQSLTLLIYSAGIAALGVCMDVALLRFLYRKRGLRLLAVGAAMVFIQNVCKIVAVAVASLTFVMRRLALRRPAKQQRRSVIRERREHLSESVGVSTSA